MKKKVALAVVALSTLACLAFGWTFTTANLTVTPRELAALPHSIEDVGLRLSRLHTADISSQHGLSVRGASLSEPFTSALSAFLVEHPQGRVLIDAGMASNMEEHFATATPAILRAFSDMDAHAGIAERLAEGGLSSESLFAVIPTHAHWDHISGMADLRSAPLWLTAAEQEFTRSGHETMDLFVHIESEGALDVHDLTFDDSAYGPFERSRDVFGDGRIVVVPMKGHTPGSVGVFVTTTSKRFLFIGDTAWASEGVDWPAEKPWVSRRIADHDYEGVRGQLVLLHLLQDANPELVIVPAHDSRVHVQIPEWPASID
ncbi:MAG: N-acyl homoserine lactone hydrolase [Polyangiales bacterium]